MQILIATSRFQDLAGSEITVLEYAIELVKQGHEVSIASFFKSERYQNECAENGIFLSVLDNVELINRSWDVIWVFHQPTFYALFAKWNYSTKHTIFSSLSHFEPLETPPIEIFPLEIITTNSEENYKFFLESYPQYSRKAKILPNSIPRDFWRKTVSHQSNKVVIVSNHIPKELIELKSLLEEKGLDVAVYGTGYIEERISPEVLLNCKLCISIGKTVQYCLALKIPIFCYDHFGGPGWITEDNISTAAAKNFSGRCSPNKYTASEILNELSSNKIPQDATLEKNYQFSRKKFNLSTNISEIIVFSGENKINAASCSTTEKNIFARTVDIFIRDSLRQKELVRAYRDEGFLREKTEQQLIQYKNAWDVESKRRFSTEDELLKLASSLEKEKLSHLKTIKQLNEIKSSKFFKSYYLIKSLLKKNRSN